jgi:hypothetical protein
MKVCLFAILDTARPDRKCRRLKLGCGQAYGCSRDVIRISALAEI